MGWSGWGTTSACVAMLALWASTAEAQPLGPPPDPPPPSDAPPRPPDSDEKPDVVAVGTPDAIDVTSTAPPPPKPDYWSRQSTLLVPRVSIGVFGDGTLTFAGSCKGDCPVAILDDEVSAADTTRLGMGLEILRSFRSPVRFGFGFQYVPRFSVKPGSRIDDDEEDEKVLGATFDIPLILEATIPATDTVGIAVRGLFGPSLFFPGGAWTQDNRAYANFCDDESGADKCRVRRFLRGAWTYGFATGPIFVVGDGTAVRADLVLQFTNVKLFKFRAEDHDWEARQEYRFDGYRLWLALGLEVM